MGALVSPGSRDAALRVASLRSQFPAGLLGLPLEPVRLGWAVEAAAPGRTQAGYQVAWGAADDDPATWRAADPVASPAAIAVVAPGGPLRARERRGYRVRVASEQGWSDWSAPLALEGGLAAGDWSARVVDVESELEGPAPLLRTEFDLAQAPVRARLHVSSLGVNEVRVNGRKVADEYFSPGWTSYGERVEVATYDVTSLLTAGRNALGATVGDGWFRGRIGFAFRTHVYGDRIGLLAQLEAELPDGTVVTVASDETWRGGFGAVRSTSLYDGTSVDLRLTGAEFAVPGFDDSGWAPARVVPDDLRRFEPRSVAPVRAVAELAGTLTPQAGRVRVDLGQNISGWVRLTVRGRAGQTVTVRHAEVLQPDGELYTLALRAAKATDTYVLGHDGESTLEPVFTFHGFRYADVVTDAEVVAAVGVAISSDLARRGTFSSSHPTLDRFYENVIWSQRDNFVSIPTDCPQRDERLGWTGDAEVFAPTANTNFDTEAFWRSWLRDLAIDQTDAGGPPSVVPDVIRPEELVMGGLAADPLGRAAWADAATIIPLSVYLSYGSDEVLLRQLDSMRRWVDHLERRAGDAVVVPDDPFQWGDWLDPDAPADRPWQTKVPPVYVANAYYAHSARILARVESLVGDPARGEHYRALGDRVAEQTWRRWGEEAVGTQTGASLALEFDLAPAAERERVAAGLAASVRAAGGRIATGFVGTPLILFALSKAGHWAEAYQMLLCREAPSWLYQVDCGATTVWERWDAMRPDGTLHTGAMDTKEGDVMISFNHYAYGAVVSWVYQNVAGLVPVLDEPGYRRVVVAPRPATALTSARATIATGLGELAVDWALDGDATLVADLTVPFGATAELRLPVTDASTVTVDGAPAPAELGYGRHRIEVTHAAVVAVPQA